RPADALGRLTASQPAVYFGSTLHANGGAMARSIMAVTAVDRPASTREGLMDAAVVLFYVHGFHAIGLDRILADVGVTKTTFYNHFESRDALIVAVLEH